MLSETTPSPSKRDEGSLFPLVQCVIRMKIWEKKKKKEQETRTETRSARNCHGHMPAWPMGAATKSCRCHVRHCMDEF